MSDHGGNIYAASRRTGIPLSQILDFSASINPLGVPKRAALLMKEHINRLPHYPEPYAEGLAACIGKQLGTRRRDDHLRKRQHRADIPYPPGAAAGKGPYPGADLRGI